MSNIRSFLENGKFSLPDNAATTTGMLHVQRVLKGIDPSRPTRFILVEGPENFKPEYWNRLVAVFTTGQAWQFKNYKWSNPTELFKHVLGVYVGWRGELPPETVRNWGHMVHVCSVERWRGSGAAGASANDATRFKDAEVVETIWKAIEGNMRAKGWRRDAAPTSI
jgi:parafibromin